MNRRGFLASALALVAAPTFDPERVLWKPGKLISIPARVHVPKWHHLWVNTNVPALARSINPRTHSLEDIKRELYQRYDRPALACLRSNINKLILDAGSGDAKFSPLAMPKVPDEYSHKPFLELPDARLIQTYDGFTDSWIRRIDVRVRI